MAGFLPISWFISYFSFMLDSEIILQRASTRWFYVKYHEFSLFFAIPSHTVEICCVDTT